MELARDGQWVAKRVGPDEVAMRANCYRIREVDFADRDTFMCSPTLVDHARERGWYQDGPFDFAAVYGDPDNQGDAYNLDRHRAFEAGLSRPRDRRRPRPDAVHAGGLRGDPAATRPGPTALPSAPACGRSPA